MKLTKILKQIIKEENTLNTPVSIENMEYIKSVRKYPTKPSPLKINNKQAFFSGYDEDKDTYRTVSNLQDFEQWKQETMHRFPGSQYTITPNPNKSTWLDDSHIIKRVK
jgi:hypothetical protein